MIISHVNRYVYVELPRTASTAVAKELIDQYQGERILHKHSTYDEFLKGATPEETEYAVFSNVRNPLDDAVSRFFKMKTDHHGRFSDPVRRKYRVGNRGASQVRATGLDAKGRRPRPRTLHERLDNRKYRYIVETDADFPSFFRRYYWVPYDSWARLSHDEMDFVIRFENVQEDFADALRRLDIDQTRPLPVINRTEVRSRSFEEQYTDEIIPRAKWVFGPYMRRWGYQFPEAWDWARPNPSSEAVYRLLAVPRTVYWRWLRRTG